MLENNLKEIISEIENGNNLGEKITLVGATKTVDIDTINRAISFGLKVVAENKVQEFREKTDKIVGAEQHFIGRLQTNKVKYLVGKVSLIHSVDSIHLAEAINKECLKKGVSQNVLLEVNIGGELSKGGFSPEEVLPAAKTISEMKGVTVKGLMAMLPESNDEEYLITLLDKTRDLFEQLKCVSAAEYLSVGMSGDYKLAIKHGSNMIRVGSKIFGKRNYEVIK